MIDEVVILAAGNGTRMIGNTPKVMRKICGKSMLQMVLDSVPKKVNKVMVCSAQVLEQVKDAKNFGYNNLILCLQSSGRGTGAATKDGMNLVTSKEGIVAVLYGDTPFICFDKLNEAAKLIKDSKANIVVVGFNYDKKNEYGKLLLKEGGVFVEKIVEKATEGTLCNSGVMIAKISTLQNALLDLQPSPPQNEYYLTNIVENVNKRGENVPYILCSKDEAIGINCIQDLSTAEQLMRKQLCINAMNNGVYFTNPDATYLLTDTIIDTGTTIEPNVIFGDNVKIGKNCFVGTGTKLENCTIEDDAIIESNCTLTDCNIGASTTIKSFSYLNGLTTEENCKIGPSTRIRPNCTIRSGSKLGPFVEIKNSVIGENTKVSHLTYIGDTTTGSEVNFGALSVICNYDGVNKHKTSIGDNVFIGSQSVLIAPVEVKSRAFLAASSIITKNIEEDDFVLTKRENKILTGGAKKYMQIKKTIK